MATRPRGVHVALPACFSTPDRQRLHEWVISAWGPYRSLPGWTMAYATDRARLSTEEEPRTTDEFNHPKAINLAVGLGDPDGLPDDVLVVADADTFPDPLSFGRRLALAKQGDWSAPARYVNLSRETTDRILADAKSFVEARTIAEAARDHVWEGGTSWAGVVLIRRDQFEKVGGYDERYDGWWADDVAFATSVETLVRPVVRLGTVYHLWHESSRAQTYERPGFAETWTTTQRYLDAAGDEDAMRALIAERP